MRDERLPIARDEEIDFSGYSEQDYNELVTKFVAWAEALAEKKVLSGATRLRTDIGETVRMRDGRLTTDGPFAEAKETINGYFIVSAASLEDAIEIAGSCPSLSLGGSVEVREVGDFPAPG